MSKVVRSRFSDGTAEIEPYGSTWQWRCTTGRCRVEVSVPQGGDPEREARRDAASHLRYEHPIEEERERQELDDAMYRDADGCERCGQEGHASKDCSSVAPWMLR